MLPVTDLSIFQIYQFFSLNVKIKIQIYHDEITATKFNDEFLNFWLNLIMLVF